MKMCMFMQKTLTRLLRLVCDLCVTINCNISKFECNICLTLCYISELACIP